MQRHQLERSINSSPYASHTIGYDRDTNTFVGWGDQSHFAWNKKNEKSLLPFFQGHVLRSMSCGMHVTFIATDRGLYGMGKGLPARFEEEHFPVELTMFRGHTVHGVATSTSHHLVWTNKGVFIGGGFKFEKTDFRPISFFDNKSVIGVWTGYEHSLILTTDALYGIGNNDSKQIDDLGSNVPEDQPRRISFFDNHNILHISVGFKHNLVVTKTGLYVWGLCAHHQLGFKPSENLGVPTKLDFFDDHKFHQISAASVHNIVWTDKGVFGWGYCADGQIGINETGSVTTPTLISFFNTFQVKEVFATGWHSCVVTTQGVYGFGRNSDGQMCGVTVGAKQVTPIRLSCFDQYTSFSFSPCLNHPELLIPLLLCRELDPASVFHKNNLPLDLFKLIVQTAQLGKIPKNYGHPK